MVIKKKRIRQVRQHLGFVPVGTRLRVGVGVTPDRQALFRRIGFTAAMGEGETVLPAPDFGPISRFNADGKEVIHRDRDMETAYRVIEWSWVEWHGQDRVERSDLRDVPYKRYPRTLVPPPSVELSVSVLTDGSRAVVSPEVEYTPEGQANLLHVVNLFLEIFGECFVLTSALVPLVPATLRRLNWEVLPPGRWPWQKLRLQLKEIVERAPKGNQVVIEERFRVLNDYSPAFVAVGRAGFRGYVVFAFPERGLFVLESAYTGNATYVFNHQWEVLSQLTKAEVLSEDLQEARLIHRRNWNRQVAGLIAREHAA